MTTPTLISLLLSLAGLFLSTFALIAARRTSAHAHSKRLSALSTQAEDHAAAIIDLQVGMKGLRARIGMAQLRQRRKELAESGEDSPNSGDDISPQLKPGTSADEEWAAKMNRAIAEGRIRPHGR